MFQPKLIDKEAGFGFARAMGSKVNRTVADANRKINPDKVEFYGQDKVDDLVKEKNRQDGNGLFGDAGIWATNLVTPRSWNVKEKILNPIDKAKAKADHYSTAAAAKIVGNRKDDSVIGRMFSTPDNKVLGKETLRDGTEREIGAFQRKTSLGAPVENTLKVVTPTLASLYVADKMYPAEEVNGEKRAFEAEWLEEKNGLEDELLTERLDKKAALSKVAQLEDELEKLASENAELEDEKNLFWKKAQHEASEKRTALQEKARIEKELLDKQAALEEYRLRTTAKARSVNAVKVAEEMLEAGMIKQAEYDKKVDFLMDCDDKTFNLHSSLTKLSKSNEKGLESSPYIIDYSNKDEESSPRRASPGKNKKGQTIGEAANDLKK